VCGAELFCGDACIGVGVDVDIDLEDVVALHVSQDKYPSRLCSYALGPAMVCRRHEYLSVEWLVLGQMAWF
jgi:hypothetical protein